MKKRLYSVFFRKHGERSWNRISGLALHKASAVRVFQSVLLGGSFAGLEMALRPVDGWVDGIAFAQNMQAFEQHVKGS